LLIKRGDAEARNVRAKVRYGDDEQIVERENVAVDGESLVFVFHDALADYQMEYAEREQRNHMASTMGWSAPVSAQAVSTPIRSMSGSSGSRRWVSRICRQNAS
jgi:hypothetical protein